MNKKELINELNKLEKKLTNAISNSATSKKPWYDLKDQAADVEVKLMQLQRKTKKD